MPKLESLGFTIFELAQLNNEHPTVEYINDLIGDDGYYDNEDGNTYIVSKSIEENNLWLYFEYGAKNPRPDYVIDTDNNNEKVQNPRSASQVEPNKQLFCVYEGDTGNLYLSNQQKKGFMEEFFKSFEPEPDQRIFVKRVYIDAEDFLAQLKTVETMKIVARPNLLSTTGDLYQPVIDIFGYGIPEQFEVFAKFGGSITQAVKDKFMRLFKEQKDGSIKKFICVGKNDDGLETIFNTENFTKKISIRLRKQENELFDADEVKDEIFKQLKPKDED